MTRRSGLTALAFALGGLLAALFAVLYLHNSPGSISVAAGAAQSGGGPVVDVSFSTVAQVGTGDHPNWVGYLPSTFVKVPANSTVRVTVDQQDTATGLRNPYQGLVRGTTDGAMTVNGKTVQAVDPTTVAHTFAVPDLGVSVPLVGVAANAPPNSSNKVVFTFRVPGPGIYHWQCFVPCGAGTLYGNGGPMQTLGYMDGQIEVGS